MKGGSTSAGPEKGTIRPIIVAVSGGATRAGLWGAAVLDQILQAQTPGGPRLFAVSSVSGGSLGTAAAMTLLSQQPKPCLAEGLPSLRATRTPVPLAGDVLGPLLAGWLLDDIPRAFFDPLAGIARRVTKLRPNGGDSAQAIEAGFDSLWLQIQPARSGETQSGWEKPYLSLFYTADRKYRTGMPLWFANGTDASTGNRVITTPITTYGQADWPFRGARDFHALMKADVAISTAINNTARFPFLEPFGDMLPADQNESGNTAGSLIDGGYFENEGLQTALELAEWLSSPNVARGRSIEPIIVEATGDGDAPVDWHTVMTCQNASDGPGLPGLEHAGPQLAEPLVGLYHVRGGHSAVLLREARDHFCTTSDGKPDYRFFHFYLPGYADPAAPDSTRRDIPLNWLISDNLARFIWTAFDNGPVCNATQLYGLKAAMFVPGPGRVAPSPPHDPDCGEAEPRQSIAAQ